MLSSKTFIGTCPAETSLERCNTRGDKTRSKALPPIVSRACSRIRFRYTTRTNRKSSHEVSSSSIQVSIARAGYRPPQRLYTFETRERIHFCTSEFGPGHARRENNTEPTLFPDLLDRQDDTRASTGGKERTRNWDINPDRKRIRLSAPEGERVVSIPPGRTGRTQSHPEPRSHRASHAPQLLLDPTNLRALMTKVSPIFPPLSLVPFSPRTPFLVGARR